MRIIIVIIFMLHKNSVLKNTEATIRWVDDTLSHVLQTMPQDKPVITEL